MAEHDAQKSAIDEDWRHWLNNPQASEGQRQEAAARAAREQEKNLLLRAARERVRERTLLNWCGIIMEAGIAMISEEELETMILEAASMAAATERHRWTQEVRKLRDQLSRAASNCSLRQCKACGHFMPIGHICHECGVDPTVEAKP